MHRLHAASMRTKSQFIDHLQDELKSGLQAAVQSRIKSVVLYFRTGPARHISICIGQDSQQSMLAFGSP
jgi:hypothetical protein